MARRMQGDACATDLAHLAVSDCIKCDIPEAMAHDGGCDIRGEITVMPLPRVVGMAMRDQRAVHRVPRVDEEITGGAVNALGFEFQNHAGNISRVPRCASLAVMPAVFKVVSKRESTMRFVRFGEAGAERPGVLDSAGNVRDLSSVVGDLASDVLTALPDVDPESLPRVEGNPRLGPPVAQVGKLIGIGLNYSDHAAEAGMDPPKEPIIFMKATSSIVGPYDDVVLPRGSEKGDWEVELGVVIGSQAKYVSEANALDHVAGYMIINDVSERAFQIERGGQWTKGKCADTFGPMGPWLVTPDEVGDPQDLDLTLDLNGEAVQRGNTSKMIFGVAHIISYVSHFMSLNPGDVIATGTPAGVGMGMKLQRFLREGDVMELGISRLGHQRQVVGRDG